MNEDQDKRGFIDEEMIIEVDKGQEAMRIDKFLMGRLEKVSRNRVQNAVTSGAITVNDAQIKPNYKVRPHDVIKLIIPRDPNAVTEVLPEDLPLDIVYEDPHLMVIHKHAGRVVHPGVGNRSGTLVNALAYHFQEHVLPVLPANSSDRPGLVHRLDKDTTGLMLIAKTENSMTHLAKQFFDHTIERSYQALVWSCPKEVEGTIMGHIGRHPTDRLKMFVYEEEEEGKHAVTHYKVIEDLYYVSLIQCNLETGRTHQIRVHMNHLGHPVFNDSRYGGDAIRKGTVYSKYKTVRQQLF